MIARPLPYVCSLLPIALIAIAGPSIAQQSDVHLVKPSAADPRVKQYDEPNVVLASAPATAPLAIFMPGSSGKPSNAIGLLRVIAGQGYRVIGLEYNDEPSVSQVCPQNPDPTCAAAFREMRGYGTGGFKAVTNPPAEAIVPRLVALLKLLAAQNPKEGWESYLDGDQPRWDRLVLSGQSQGAGMAAFFAKQHAVRRVVLFSSPWDFIARDKSPAPWLSRPSATPMSRWYAEYNAREKTAPLLRSAYAALALPPSHILVFSRDLPRPPAPGNPNPYHGINIKDPAYLPQWKVMFGEASDPVTG